MLASQEDKRCADLPLPSCAIAVQSVPTCFDPYGIYVHVAKHMKVCKMEELGESVVWREAIGLVAIKTFLEAHGDVFDLEEWGETVMMSLKSTTHSTDQNQRAAAGSPSSITNSGVWRSSGQVHWDHKCVCLSTLKVSPRFGFKSWVSPAELRWTHNKNQRLFSCGRRLQDVAASP